MSLQEELCRIANGGLVTGKPPDQLGSNDSPDCQNLDPAEPLGAQTRPGSSSYAATTAGSGFRGAWLTPWTRDAGTTYIFTQLGTIIYSVGAAGTYTSIQTGVATDSFGQAAFLNNLAVVVASGIAPKVSTAGSTLASLSGTPPSLAKYACVYQAKMWLAGDTANPTKVTFSKSNDPEDYTTINNAGNIVIANTGDIIRGLEPTKRALYVFMRSQTWIITGSTPFDFQVDLLFRGGIVSEWGHCSDGNGAFFACDDGIYYASGFNMARISDPVRPTYLNISDKSTITMEVKGEKLFVFYRNASGTGENDSCLVLAFKRQMTDGSIRGVWGLYNSQPFHGVKTSRANNLYAITNASSPVIYELDTGTSATVTAYFNTPDLDFGDYNAIKNMQRFWVHIRPPNATLTLTTQWFNEAGSIGSAYSQSVGTIGSHIFLQAPAKTGTSISGHRLRAKFSWTGNMLVYGWRTLADIRAEGESIGGRR